MVAEIPNLEFNSEKKAEKLSIFRQHKGHRWSVQRDGLNSKA